LPGRLKPGEFGFLSAQRNVERSLLFGPRFYSWEQCLMNESKSKKNAPLHDGFEWAGAVARVRRGVRSSRAGRRTALLSMLTAAYVNSSRGGRISDRSVGER
jgi:hypothetical protein